MARITIRLPDPLADRARRAARASGKPLSRWIADRLREHCGEAWPESVLKAAGAFPDFPTLEEIRGTYGSESPREF